nr:MAG TPA: B-ZIP transcription factor [Caudoviricetes sp.]
MLPIYDKDFVLLDGYDPGAGKLEKKSRTIHTDAVETVEEQWHYETIREYPETGGRDVKKVIDVPGVEGREAEDVVEEYYLFTPYTEAEREAQREPTISERCAALEKENAELKAWLSDTNAAIIELAGIMEGEE